MAAAHISIVGKFDPEYAAHVATREAVIHAAADLGCVLNTRWVVPDELEDAESALADSCGALIAPRNPKTPRQLWPEIVGALAWLRQKNLPTLAIEYGYQHMVIQSAREVLGLDDANSLAYDEATSCPVITRLHVDEAPIDKFHPIMVDFDIEEGSELAKAYGRHGQVSESFRGHYVMNPDYASEFEQAGAKLSARGHHGGVDFLAAMEWPELDFYMGVAWLPQNTSGPGAPHPLIRAFVEQAVRA